MPLAEAAAEMSMLPRMIEVVVNVILPRIMPHPLVSAGVHVGGIRVALLVAVGSSLFSDWSRPRFVPGRSRFRGRSGMRRRAMRGNVSPANAAYATTAILGGRGNCKQQESEEYSEQVFRFTLLSMFGIDLEAVHKKHPLRVGTTLDVCRDLAVAHFCERSRRLPSEFAHEVGKSRLFMQTTIREMNRL